MIYLFKVIHNCKLKYVKSLKMSDIYALDPACFLTAPGLVYQAALKKTKIRSFN